MPQLAVLHTLAENGPLRAVDLAHRTGLSASSITGFLDRLEAEQLVRRERSSTDRREIVIHLTDCAQAVLEQMQGVVSAELEKMFEVLGTEELEQLGVIVQKLLNSLSQGPT